MNEGLIKPGDREDEEVKITYEWKHKKSKSLMWKDAATKWPY
jgi:hypothetical protein